MAKIHSSNYKPRCFPLNGDSDPSEMDRVQSITASPTPNREAINEVGRLDQVGYVRSSFEVTYDLTQFEYGSMEFYKKLANVGDSVQTITLSDFRTSALDIAAYLTDDANQFIGTLWYPNLRTNGFSLNIGDPNAIAERSFNLLGDSVIRWQGDNKYVVYEKKTVESGEAGTVIIDLSSRVPAKDPTEPNGNNADYFIRILRVRGSTNTELQYTTHYTYNPTNQQVSVLACETGDIIKILYTSATAPATIFVPNDIDPVALTAPYASIYLYIPGSGKPSSADYLYRCQSIGLETSFDREDLGEIGTDLITERGIGDQTVTINLSQRNSLSSLEQIFSGQAADYGKIDFNQFSNSIAVIVKFFKDANKTNFAYGFKTTNCSVTGLGGGINVLEYLTREGTLESKNLTITEDEVELGI